MIKIPKSKIQLLKEQNQPCLQKFNINNAVCNAKNRKNQSKYHRAISDTEDEPQNEVKE
ncbi:hypothetical protein AGMMS49579_22130 [Spirochaetia bacterium]|nr:hypothetical protein AGMMS49579_22130 [Spirochaetia bacterium]